MSRHRKIKNLNYDEEYDDYYNPLDDEDDEDFDFDENQFEEKYLSSGIDLKINKLSANSTNQTQQQHQHQPSATSINDTNLLLEFDDFNKQILEHDPENGTLSSDNVPSELVKLQKDLHQVDVCSHKNGHSSDLSCIKPEKGITLGGIDGPVSDLTKLAIQHLDKHQWQLPLLEMDKKFRDKTYYKHYTENYITSLRSKLGHFLTDSKLLKNPMKYHTQRELDNYQKHSKMFALLTEYYQSLGGNFFSFATPSPDEEIVIGCRLGTKAAKKQPNSTCIKNEQATARFDYQGKQPKQRGDKSKVKQLTANQTSASNTQVKNPIKQSDLVIQEDHVAEQLDDLVKKVKEAQALENARAKKAKPSATSVPLSSSKALKQPSALSTTAPSTSQKQAKQTGSQIVTQQQPKQLASLVEKRQNLKRKLKQSAEPSAQDWEAFKLKALQTTNEYNELMKDSRCRINLVVVGHVDAGKSTLIGHLLYKLGQVSKKQMHRNEVDSQRSGKASFKFAWALDETSEERARGVTIDIALTKFETAHKDVVLFDAPGHVDFIPAVISGAAQADAALLVVDATRGEFETGFQTGGQTREHTFLVRSLGVKSLIVLVNKMDMVDWNWSRFNDIVEQLGPFLKQVGFNLRDDVQFVPVSGLTGDNLIERRQDKLRKESSHPQLESALANNLNTNSLPSLLEAIDKMRPPMRMVDKPTRASVTDVFKGMSSGVFLGAKVTSGKIETKQKLLLLPPNEMCEIKQVEVRDSKSTTGAFAGDIITTTAIGIDMNKYYRGCILCDPLIPCHVTNRFQARIIMFQSANTILIKGTPIEVHMNGSFECGVVRKLLSLLNKSTGELIQKRPRCIAQNASAIIQLKLDRVVCCELYEDNKDLGRFMIRSYGKTIAAGLITKIKSPKVSKSGRTKMRSKK